MRSSCLSLRGFWYLVRRNMLLESVSTQTSRATLLSMAGTRRVLEATRIAVSISLRQRSVDDDDALTDLLMQMLTKIVGCDMYCPSQVG